MIRALTLGIAAKADWNPARPRGTGVESIVLVSDREYEDEDGARSESPVPKRTGLIQGTWMPGRSGWFCLFSTLDLSEVEDYRRTFRLNPEVSFFEKGYGVPTTDHVIELAERTYAAQKRARGVAGFSSDLLVVGFDEYQRPAIFQIGESGRAELRAVPGYALTGSGASHAGPHLYWHDLQPDDPLYQVLYKVCSAKRHAEKIVGPTTDVAILLPDRADPIIPGTKVMEPIETAMAALEAPIFASERKAEPEAWRETLRERVEAMLNEARGIRPKRKRGPTNG